MLNLILSLARGASKVELVPEPLGQGSVVFENVLVL